MLFVMVQTETRANNIKLEALSNLLIDNRAYLRDFALDAV